MKRCCLFLLFFALLFAPVGCAKEQSTVELHPYSQPSVDKSGLCVNISSKTIHLDPDCRHVQTSREENLRYTAHTTESVNTLFSMGYTLCQDCSQSDTA